MKYVCKKKVLSYLILVGLLCNMSAAKQAKKFKFLEEICVVACLPGQGPGQYYHWLGAGYNLWPRCFTIDPNDGAFYIPEVDTYDNIRLHKFDRNGNFITMIKPEGKAYFVYDIVVSSKGDLYMDVERRPGSCICRYNNKGKLLKMFGPKGPITKEDLEAERKAKEQYEEPNREKYFHGGSRVYLLPSDEVFVVRIRDYGKRILDTYKFDGRSGRLLELIKENRDLPKEIAHKRASHLKKLEALCKAEHEQKRITGRAHSLIGPDGFFYYMSVKPERLEIRQVLFGE